VARRGSVEVLGAGGVVVPLRARSRARSRAAEAGESSRLRPTPRPVLDDGGPGVAVAGADGRSLRVSVGGRSAPRVLPRAVPAARYRLRRAVAAVALAVVSAAVVVGLGLVAGAAGEAHARAAVPSGTALVTVQPGESVWEVARRAPAVGTAGTDAVVERIAADNRLPVDAAPLPAGLVLRVPA
jgi:hypothetical protein